MSECERFQQAVMTDSARLDATLAGHERVCDTCAAVAARARELDARIHTAFEVRVPGHLQQTLARVPAKTRRGPMPYFKAGATGTALAASFILGMVAGPRVTGFKPVEPVPAVPLQKLVYEHILGEPQALTTVFPVKRARVNTTLKEFGVELSAPLGEILHITLCPVGNTHGLHLVVQGRRGPVTLLFLPSRSVDGRTTFEQGRFAGVIKPAVAGVVAIVGEKNEPLETIENRVQKSIKWL